MLALRVARRRVPWADGAIDDIVKIEFSRAGEPDLSLSVYEIEPHQLVQTVAEHAASFDADPRGFPNLDMSGRPMIVTRGETVFSFTQAAHRELQFQDVDDLKTYLASIVRDNTRIHKAEKSDVKAYAHGKRNNDPEWSAFYADGRKWPP